jgi:hypothetical protein
MRFLTLAAAALGAALLSGQATAQSIPYTCVGIGTDQREAAANVPHTLKLVFAEPDGQFLADVTTRVTDSGGNQLLHLICGGPWLMLDLAPGTYRIDAEFEGQSKSVSVTVGTGRREQLITFASDSL